MPTQRSATKAEAVALTSWASNPSMAALPHREPGPAAPGRDIPTPTTRRHRGCNRTVKQVEHGACGFRNHNYELRIAIHAGRKHVRPIPQAGNVPLRSTW